jgi:hypothetical protein
MESKGYQLTEEGSEAMDTIRGLFTDLGDEGLVSILFGLVKKDQKLDYIRIEKGGPSFICKCQCERCHEDRFMTIGWTGHIQWIKTGLCPLCKMMEEGR